MSNKSWYQDPRFLLELFALVNVSFLAVDIYSAHLVNNFAHWAEWLPFYFSLTSPVLLLPILFTKNPLGGWCKPAGLLVGWLAVALGILGLIYHLESQFFSQTTLESLVYTAPFVAPLAYSGIGFLLILNRMVPAHTAEWSRWILLLASAGFLGNFILSVCDHAQNGFFHWAEWIPVVAAAFAISFLMMAAFRPKDIPFARLCLWQMGLQLVIGLMGFYYHVAANLHAVGANTRDNFIYGAPVFAPLLFANLALLASLGLVDLMIKARQEAMA